jgi:hypothetical protein
MIRRFALAALMGVVCTAFVADVAGAYTRAQAICVKAVRTKAKNTVLSARSDATSTLQGDLKTCLNAPGSCVTDCQAALTLCQFPYLDLKTGSVKACRDDCKAANGIATGNCANLAQDKIVACVATAELDLFTCNQACQAAAQPALIECNGQYNDCLQICAN